MIRLGVIGCGEIAQIMHLPFAHALPQFEIAAVCDASPTVVEAVGERFGVRARYADYEELLAGPVDAVIVATPDHAGPAQAALHAGKHVLVEKPLAWSPAEARAIVEAAERSSTVAMVGYMKRYDPGYEHALKRIARMGTVRFGRVHDFAGRFDRHASLFTLTRGDDVSDALVDASLERSAAMLEDALGTQYAGYRGLYWELLMLATHDLAVMRGAFGDPVEILSSVAPDDHTLIATLVCERAPICQFEMSTAPYEWWDETLTAYGDEDIVTVEFANPFVPYARSIVRADGAEAEVPMRREIKPSYDPAFRRELVHFAHCIETGAAPRTPVAAGAADVEFSAELIRTLPLNASTEEVQP